jgi:hypothetical protein
VTEIFWDLGLMGYQARFVLLNMTSRMNLLPFIHKTSNDYIRTAQQYTSPMVITLKWLFNTYL